MSGFENRNGRLKNSFNTGGILPTIQLVQRKWPNTSFIYLLYITFLLYLTLILIETRQELPIMLLCLHSFYIESSFSFKRFMLLWPSQSLPFL